MRLHMLVPIVFSIQIDKINSNLFSLFTLTICRALRNVELAIDQCYWHTNRENKPVERRETKTKKYVNRKQRS